MGIGILCSNSSSWLSGKMATLRFRKVIICVRGPAVVTKYSYSMSQKSVCEIGYRYVKVLLVFNGEYKSIYEVNQAVYQNLHTAFCSYMYSNSNIAPWRNGCFTKVTIAHWRNRAVSKSDLITIMLLFFIGYKTMTYCDHSNSTYWHKFPKRVTWTVLQTVLLTKKVRKSCNNAPVFNL